jgi:hypothetical protein
MTGASDKRPAGDDLVLGGVPSDDQQPRAAIEAPPREDGSPRLTGTRSMVTAASRQEAKPPQLVLFTR